MPGPAASRTPEAGLSGTAPANGRRLLAERGVRERLKRLVQRRQLVRDANEALGRLKAAVERVHLVAEPVEALENRVELTIVQLLALHAPDLSPKRAGLP